MFKNKGIAVKFIVAVTGVTQLLLVALAVVVISTSYKTQRLQADSFIATLQAEQKQQELLLADSLTRKGDSLAALLAQTGAVMVISYDFDGLLRLGNATLKDEDVVAVVYTGKDGTVYAESKSGQPSEKSVRHDLVYDGETLGAVEVSLKFDSVTRAVSQVSGRINQLVVQANEELTAAAWRLGWVIIGVMGVIVFVLCGAIYFSLNLFVIKPVMRVVDGLNDSSVQVKASSGQLAGASQQLADGASRGASSLEETSASLEEVSSMTKSNAENASECNGLMREVNDVVARASSSMENQNVAMTEISRASSETQKIVKTIDEIAFQTNLLALNAAVEAARAGEAGAGFAVVADEVRNLAMRAAAAAKDTAGLIDSTVAKIKEGEGLALQTNENFGQVSERAAKVGVLINEIAVASGEQNSGLGEVNSAMVEIDQVTQQTAANSEEAASASEELSSQADYLEQYVQELVALIKGGKAAQQHQSAQARPRQGQKPLGGKVRAAALPAPAPVAVHKDKKAPQKKRAQEAIPFDEDEFEDF